MAVPAQAAVLRRPTQAVAPSHVPVLQAVRHAVQAQAAVPVPAVTAPVAAVTVQVAAVPAATAPVAQAVPAVLAPAAVPAVLWVVHQDVDSGSKSVR